LIIVIALQSCPNVLERLENEILILAFNADESRESIRVLNKKEQLNRESRMIQDFM